MVYITLLFLIFYCCSDFTVLLLLLMHQILLLFYYIILVNIQYYIFTVAIRVYNMCVYNILYTSRRFVVVFFLLLHNIDNYYLLVITKWHFFDFEIPLSFFCIRFFIRVRFIHAHTDLKKKYKDSSRYII